MADAGKKVSISLSHETHSRFHALEDDEHDPAFDYSFESVPILIQSASNDGPAKSSEASGSDYDDRFACDCEDCTPPSSNEDSGEEEDLLVTPQDNEEEQFVMNQSRTSSGRSSVSSSLLIPAAGSLPKDSLQLPLLELADVGDAANESVIIMTATNLPRPRPRGSSIKELRQTKGVEYFDY